MKYLELFKQGFDSTLAEKVKVENWPYVGHDSVTGEVVYTELPVTPTSFIYYTTIDEKKLDLYTHYQAAPGRPDNWEAPLLSNVPVKSNTYNKIGTIVFDGIIEDISYDSNNDGGGNYYAWGFFNGQYKYGERFVGPVASTILSVTLPSTIKSITGLFISCSNLETINFEGTKEQWNAIEKPDYGITGVGTVKWNYSVPATVVHCSDGDVTL